MYCPECYEAELGFYPNAKTPHFKTKPSSKHNADCSCNFPVANKKEIVTYCSDPNNQDAIERKLKSCLELLNKAKTQKNPTMAILDKENEKSHNYYTLGEGEARKSIRRKKISTPFDESKDYNLPTIFYGKAIVEWDLRNENVKYLRVKNINTEETICSIKVSNNIYGYIKKEMKFNTRRNVDIAFITTMVKDKYFNNCSIRYSTELIMSNISTSS